MSSCNEQSTEHTGHCNLWIESAKQMGLTLIEIFWRSVLQLSSKCCNLCHVKQNFLRGTLLYDFDFLHHERTELATQSRTIVNYLPMRGICVTHYRKGGLKWGDIGIGTGALIPTWSAWRFNENVEEILFCYVFGLTIKKEVTNNRLLAHVTSTHIINKNWLSASHISACDTGFS